MKSEQITKLYFKDVNHLPKIDRRGFLKRLGSGIIIVFSLSDLALLEGCSTKEEDTPDFNAYLRVKEDGRVDCLTGKIEMGQGVITSLGQVLAEELEISLDQVDMIMGDTELCPYDAGTWGSMTTRFADPVLRAAAAEAREVLKELAAEKLGVKKSQLSAKDGTIFVTSDKSKSITYASLTKGQKIVRTLKKKPEIKKASEFKIIGKSIISRDAVAKVTGKAKYSADIRLPGMVYASVVRPPSHGSKLLSVDTSKVSRYEGAEFIRDGDLLAVLHTDPIMAAKASRRVKAKWEIPESKANDETIFEYLKKVATDHEVSEEGGDLKKGRKMAKEVLEEEYYDGYKAHASIETHTALARFEGDKLTVWASSQTPFGTREALAETFKIPLERVHMKQIFLGGGFGGKIYNQQAIEAAKLAKKSGKPVQLAWTRREEFMYDMFRPAAVMDVSAGVDEQGKLTFWEYDIYCAGTRGTNLFYDIPNNRTRGFDGENIHPFGTGAWRAPGNNTTTFARESHIDAIAHQAGIDPLEFRVKNLKEKKMKQALDLAAKAFDWNREKPEGHGFGIALGADAGTYVAMFVEVKVDKSTGDVQPIRVVCGQHMGQVVNPHGAILQTEGGILMGLGYALKEDIQFDWGKVKNRNFDSYDFTRFSMAPEIECLFVDAMEEAPQGGGEPAIVCVGGAIANAVFDACGARVNRMPVTPERILEAVKDLG